MRAFREIFGGLFLAVLAAATVIGGLWLAVTETGLGSVPSTAIVEVTGAATPTAFVPSQTAKPLPSNTATLVATMAPTPTGTATNTATLEPSLTATTVKVASTTDTATLAPTATATATSTNTATLAPAATSTSAPSSPTVCAPPQGWAQYVVVPGDTLFQLSLRYGISQQQLQAANCLGTPEIKYGQTLFVPFVASATAQEPTATATTLPTETPVPSPLVIEGFTVVSVQSDPSRSNGAIASLYFTVSGGVAPYTFYKDDAPQASNPFQYQTECNGVILFTLRVLSADGQSAEHTYYYSPVVCP